MAEASDRSGAVPIVTRTLVAAIWIVLGCIAVVHFINDSRDRVPAEAFVRRFTIEQRRPEYAETIRNAPAADWAADLAADVAIQDVTSSVNVAGMDESTRRLWMESLAHFDKELVAAENLVLDALDDRPGWPYHRASLGMLQYLRNLRAVRLGDRPELWFVPMRSALQSAPGDESFAPFAGSALITAWPFVTNEIRAASPAVFRLAMRDAGFVDAYYLDIAYAIGRDQAAHLLPDMPRSLRAALRAESDVGDVPAAGQLQSRWEMAEWRERIRDLTEIDQRSHLGDRLGTIRACQRWTSRHAPGDFDTGPGRRQLGEVLDRWPDEPGDWQRDPRADIVRFLLNGREFDPVARTLERTVSILTDVPPPLAARAAILAGDVYTAESIARKADTAGAFEWTRFYVDLAYEHLRAKRNAEAAAALTLVSPAARDECDVIVARQDVDSGSAVPAEAAVAETSTYTPELWSRLNVAICVPRATRTLEVEFILENGPALLSWGFDQGRLGTALFPRGRGHISLATGERAGRHVFSLAPLTGDTPQPELAILRR